MMCRRCGTVPSSLRFHPFCVTCAWDLDERLREQRRERLRQLEAEAAALRSKTLTEMRSEAIENLRASDW